MPSSGPYDEYALDPRAVRRGFDRASASYANAAGVQAEIRARLLERLDLVKLQPATVLDLGSASGQSSRALKDRYPKSQVIALDASLPMLSEARRAQGLLRRFQRVAADAHRLPIRAEAIDLAFSNLMLAWCTDPDRVFSETARVLRAGGLFMFTSLGPDTLRELREAFRRVDAHTHVHRFIDMHDIGDALLRAGFAEPVMDTERLTVTYASAERLMEDLRGSGAANATAGRRRGLLGRNAWGEVARHLDANREQGLLKLSVEVVYGHAWRAELPRSRRERPGEVAIPIAGIGRRIDPKY